VRSNLARTAFFCVSAKANSFWLLVIGAAILILPSQGNAQEQRYVPGQILVKPKTHLAEKEFTRRINSHGAFQQRIFHRANVRVLAVAEEQTGSVLAALRADPDIEFAERDPIAQACTVDNDPYVVSGAEWHLQKIQALQAWDITIGTSNVTIAVLDSGVNPAHPDLQGRVLPGYDFVNNDLDAMDDFGHGTAVAGTIVAGGNNGLGVAGIAYGCSVLPIKVMDQYGSASHSTIALGIEYAVLHGARVINLSLGGNYPSSTLQNAINYAWSNNVLIVAAAGNNGSTVLQYPAACQHVLAVGASEPDDSRATFSNYGSYVPLFAPGDNIWTTQRDLNNPYGSWRGTSFASPVVAGVAALGLSLNPSLSNDEITEILRQTADPVQTIVSPSGVGRINALSALNAISLQAGVPSSPSSQSELSLEPISPSVPPVLNQDTVLPVVTIVSGPANGARLLTQVVSLAGSASDNAGIARVEVQVNGAANQVCNGTTTWDAQINLVPGYNLIHVRSIDTAGNISFESLRAFTYVMTAPVVLQVNGMGALDAGFNGTQLEVGRNYRIKAVPGPGQLFAGWSGSIRSDAQVLSFTMETNLILVANFVLNPFLSLQGHYAGLMVNSNTITTDNSGYLSLATTKSGTFSGKVLISGKHFGFTGKLNISGDANVSIRRGLSSPLALALHVEPKPGSSSISGQISGEDWTSDLIADRNVFNASNPAEQTGIHSLDLTSQDGAATASGISRISPGGMVKVRGKLNNDQVFSTSSSLAKNGDSPFYVSRNQGSEMIIGWLNFPAGQSATSGTVMWVRTGMNAFASTLRAAAGAD